MISTRFRLGTELSLLSILICMLNEPREAKRECNKEGMNVPHSKLEYERKMRNKISDICFHEEIGNKKNNAHERGF